MRGSLPETEHGLVAAGVDAKRAEHDVLPEVNAVDEDGPDVEVTERTRHPLCELLGRECVVMGPVERGVYAQIKKPSEDTDGTPRSSLWTVMRAEKKLLPGTIERLAANAHQQVWMLRPMHSLRLVNELKASVSEKGAERRGPFSP